MIPGPRPYGEFFKELVTGFSFATNEQSAFSLVPPRTTFNFKNMDSQNPNGKTAPQVGVPKSSKMLFGHRNRHKCVVHALSHGRIRVLVKEHQKHVVPLALSIVFVVAHQNNEKKKNLGWGSFGFCESLSLKRSSRSVIRYISKKD
jgi:hypothetical protein